MLVISKNHHRPANAFTFSQILEFRIYDRSTWCFLIFCSLGHCFPERVCCLYCWISQQKRMSSKAQLEKLVEIESFINKIVHATSFPLLSNAFHEVVFCFKVRGNILIIKTVAKLVVIEVTRGMTFLEKHKSCWED